MIFKKLFAETKKPLDQYPTVYADNPRYQCNGRLIATKDNPFVMDTRKYFFKGNALYQDSGQTIHDPEFILIIFEEMSHSETHYVTSDMYNYVVSFANTRKKVDWSNLPQDIHHG